jgi:Amt family ammonium transporter
MVFLGAPRRRVWQRSSLSLAQGYSLAFSDGASKFIGNLQYFGAFASQADHRNLSALAGWMGVLDQPSLGNTRIPALLYCFYQMQFAAVTAVIAFGAIAERGRIGPTLVAVFCWLTLVYCPIACWTWNPAGWSFQMGTLDFAGGGPVHVASGTAALAFSVFLGHRKDRATPEVYRPHSVSHVVLGTVMLWFGWFGASVVSLETIQTCSPCFEASTVEASWR